MVEDCWSRQIPELWELGGVDDDSGELVMLVIACVGMQEGATHSDDGIRSRHLQLEVRVVRDRHELSVAWPPQDGVVGP